MRGLRLGFGVGVGGGVVSAYPSLIMDFVPTAGIEVERSSRTFDQLIDFTRTSAATYVDAAGKIVPTPASRNLLTFTQEFDNAAWTKARCTVLSNVVAAPDGTLTADATAQIAGQTALGVVSQTFTSIAGSTNIAISVYAKANQKGLLAIGTDAVGTVGANFYSFFNLLTGAVGTASSGHTLSITSVGNGWYRCTVVCATRSGGGNVTILFGGADTNNSTTVTDSGGVFIWGAQLEANTTATDYTRNNGGVYPPRFDYDPVTLAPKGLLVEEQRTNLLTYSEQFDNAAWAKTRSSITANAATSPDGTVDADKLVEDTSAGTHTVSRLFAAASAAQPYGFSVYAKAAERSILFIIHANATIVSFNLAAGTCDAGGVIQAAGNGWYRCSVTTTAPDTVSRAYALGLGAPGSNYTGDGTSGIYIWGAQLEAGSFATSYIPTVASQVTRTADVATITGANFSQWYNQSEGTIVWEGDFSAFSSNRLVAIDGGVSVRTADINAVPNAIVYYKTSDAQQISMGAATAGSLTKVALAIKANDFNGAINGTLGGADTATGGVATADRLSIGHWNNSSFLNGHIRSIKYFPTRLSNSQLQALTA